jgi:hypothetical protein
VILGMLFVLLCGVAGSGFAAAQFYRGESMALYEVRRTDDVKPGEFDNAVVIAGGTALARAAVVHMLPKGAKVEATRVETANVGTTVLTAYFDEREPAAAADDIDTFPLF